MSNVVRLIALKMKETGADVHAIGDGGFAGCTSPENIHQLSVSIRPPVHLFPHGKHQHLIRKQRRTAAPCGVCLCLKIKECVCMKLAIGNDHVAVEMKKEIKKYLEDKGIEVIDVGTNSTESFNYPISGYKVGKMVASGEVDGGVLICGTGVGISMAANKVKGVRACVCSEPILPA